MKKVTVYTDGACSGNPGPGGWAAVLICGEVRKEIGGGEASTTNNRMEITAAVKALEALKMPCEVNIYSDSAYLVDAHQKFWLKAWQKNNWMRKTSSGSKEVLNRDLWERLLELEAVHTVHWHKVDGHAGVAENEVCDKIAVRYSLMFKDSR